MAAGISRPDVWAGLALNRDPNDPNTPAVWTAIESSRMQFMGATEQVRGRDYELAQAMSSSPKVFIRDVNEDLNPDNPSSPYAGDVECYREICMLAQWPITPVGGAVNLFNTGAWRGSGVDVFDPTFESYTNGAAAPNWLDGVAIFPGPTITTTNPQQGTKCATFGVLGGSGSGQGVRFPVTVIPGRQYTTSAYVRQSAANTMGIFLEGVTAVYDPFNRTVASGVGNPPASWTGATYTATGGAGGDYNVTPGALVMTLTSTSSRSATIGSFFDSEQTVLVTAPELATGDSYVIGAASRRVDVDNLYRALIRFDTDGSLGLRIDRRLAGVQTTIEEVDLPLTYAAGDQFYLHFSTQGTVLYAYLWPATRPPSRIYSTAAISDTSAALQVAAPIALTTFRLAANTNTNLPSTFNRYTATGSVIGDTTATSGSYVRLDITYTADGIGRPASIDGSDNNNDNGRGLCIKLITVGSTSAATVNVDALQHEPGASVSSFNASGPVIYPIFRHNVERYPRGWASRGFEGATAAPCVDALAQLNKIRISTEYTQAVLGLQPDLYYPLNSSGENALAAELSGNAGPPLVPVVSVLGAGTPVSGGAQMDIPGDPGGTGSTFTWIGPADNFHQQGTILGVGSGTDNPAPIGFPVQAHGAWAMSVAMWVVITPTAETTPALFSINKVTSTTPLLEYRPIQINASGTVSLRNGAPSGSNGTPLAVEDGALHLVIGQIVQDGTDTTFRFRRDLEEDETTVSTATFGGLFPNGRANTLTVGGTFYALVAGVSHVVSGSIAQVAIWNRELTSGERDQLWAAGSAVSLNEPLVAETTGQRIYRHIVAGNYTGPLRVLDRGTSLLGAPSYIGSIDLYTDSLNSAQADLGAIWVQPDGVIAFEGRADRWARLTSDATFGEDLAGGEIPYETQPIFDRDPTYVFPMVTWKRSDGGTYQGGLPKDVQAALRRYFPRQFDGQSDFVLDSQAQDAADGVFYTHRVPGTRVEVMTFDPWATPSLWPTLLCIEPGRRVTVKRRAKAANGGAGLTMSLDFFIEKVSIPEINFTQGRERWAYEIQMSPIGSTGAPTPMQPWILGDSVWGVLDSTTVLGW